MAQYTEKLQEAEVALDTLLNTELKQIVEAAIAEPGTEGSLFVEIPTGQEVDLSTADLAALVAKTSNNYQKACRFVGIASAIQKRAEGRYKKKFKLALSNAARNAQEREAKAMEASAIEYSEYNLIESIVELASYMESATRIASESARKLLDKSAAMHMGYARETAGHMRDSDYYK